MTGGRWALGAIVVGVLQVLAAAAPAHAATAFFGLNNNPFAAGSDTPRAVGAHRELGSDVVRVGLRWDIAEPHAGTLRWESFDELYHASLAAGMQPLALLTAVPPWAAKQVDSRACREDDRSRCKPPPSPDHLDELRRFVAAVMRRYPRLVALEVFNEPNFGAAFWQPSADPEYYAHVLREVVGGVDDAASPVPVISGGVTNVPDSAADGSMNPFTFLRRMYAAGVPASLDGIAIHPYVGRKGPRETGPRTFASFLDEVRAIRAANGVKTPLWITEAGYSTEGSVSVSMEEQSEYLGDLVRVAMAATDVRSLIIHTLLDRTEDANAWGLMTRDFRRKPSFAAVRAAVAEVRREAARRAARTERRRARKAGTRSLRSAKRRCSTRRRGCLRYVSARR